MRVASTARPGCSRRLRAAASVWGTRTGVGEVGEGSQLHNPDPVPILFENVRPDLKRQPGFPSASRACEGHQAALTEEGLDVGHLPRPSQETRQLERQVVRQTIQGSQRWEVACQVADHNLEKALRTGQILQSVLAQIPKSDCVGEVILHEGVRCLGDKNLPPMPRGADAGGAMDVHSHVARLGP